MKEIPGVFLSWTLTWGRGWGHGLEISDAITQATDPGFVFIASSLPFVSSNTQSVTKLCSFDLGPRSPLSSSATTLPRSPPFSPGPLPKGPRNPCPLWPGQSKGSTFLSLKTFKVSDFGNECKSNHNEDNNTSYPWRRLPWKKPENNKCSWGREETGALVHQWRECQVVQPLFKQLGGSSKNEARITIGAGNSTPRKYPRKLKAGTQTRS